MLTKAELENVIVFLERASKTLNGTVEHGAFAETYLAVHREVAEVTTPLSTCCGDATHGCQGLPR